MLAATALQRLMISLNAVATAASSEQRPAMESFRASFVPALAALAEGGDLSPDLDKAAVAPGFLGDELGRMVAQARLLRTALARLATGPLGSAVAWSEADFPA